MPELNTQDLLDVVIGQGVVKAAEQYFFLLEGMSVKRQMAILDAMAVYIEERRSELKGEQDGLLHRNR